MSNPGISVIICTYKREKKLWECLLSFIEQITPEDEIIIIDQNTPGLTVPDNLKHENLKHIHMLPPSLTKARNKGMETSRCSMVLFLDDDIIADSGLLDTYRKTAASRPDCVIGGSVEQEDRADVDGVGYVNLKTGEIVTNYSDCKNPGYVPFFSGANFLIPGSCTPPPARV